MSEVHGFTFIFLQMTSELPSQHPRLIPTRPEGYFRLVHLVPLISLSLSTVF